MIYSITCPAEDVSFLAVKLTTILLDVDTPFTLRLVSIGIAVAILVTGVAKLGNQSMTLDEFKQLMKVQEQPPDYLFEALRALWYDKKGDWHQAHQIAQDSGSTDSAWVHAYLHRKEGDLSNARYWYNRAGQSTSQQSLDTEWEQIVKDLLGRM